MTLPGTDPNTDHNHPEQPQLHDDTRFASPKIAIFQYITVLVFLFLVWGFYRLQIQNPSYYEERAQQNRIRSLPLLAPRGRILDRDGRVIVDNHNSFTLYLARENLKEEHLPAIAQGLDIDLTDLETLVRHYKNRPKFQQIRLKDEMTPADLAFVESHQDFFPELEIVQSHRRLYPQDGFMAHLLGYTGEISDKDLDLPEFANLKMGDIIGKTGVERQYNDTLMGVDGQRQVEVDVRNRIQHEFKEQTKPAIPGKDLQLTIDLDLQSVAELAMDGRNGAVVALDPRNGEVLAMVSRPTFDLNKFVGGIKSKDLKPLLEDPDKPFLNRAIQAAQAPGSTFKPIMSLAALETGTIEPSYSVHCPGYANYFGRVFHCDVKTGHGTLQLHSAIAESCDVYFYSVGNKLGIDNIAKYGDMFGYGHPTGIDLPAEATGVLPSPQWKIRKQNEKWYAGETISVSIGQGALTATPIGIARAIAGIAMGGELHRPHVAKDRPDQVVKQTFEPENLKTVVDGMYGVVNDGGGTGVWARLPNIEVCGKTGTAQVASLDYVKSVGGGHNLKENAWFVAFAPRQAPEILVLALFEHGQKGYLASPIVRDVMKAYFDKKVRIETFRQQQGAVSSTVAAVSTLGLPTADKGVHN